MVFNAASVGAAVTPTVLETAVAHYLNRRPRRGKPTAHISYDAALNLIRQFLVYASHHTVEDVQAFTSQWVPAPSWVKLEDVEVPQSHLARAASHIQAQLGPSGIEEVGGPTWWQWRREKKPLHAEWVEMRKDHVARMKHGGKTQRTMLYVHGGGYYFGSVDEHRYQIQRHARKLQARVLCPRYRLSPQFPFPCGLLDCLATYLFMLETQPPETIILAGDSAGGGMVLAMQIVMRDQGIPLPAGSVLISPWVDLTHSFPSVAGDNPLDYIPPYGFHHRPSDVWPPPNSDDLAALDEVMVKGDDGNEVSMRELKAQIAAKAGKHKKNDGAGYSVEPHDPANSTAADASPATAPANLTIVIDGDKVELKDQIQMYAPNAILAHPLVSPVLQASLGGLPPMQVCVGGGEMLRDEQIYLAHKAANPAAYPAPPTKYADSDAIAAAIAKYPPTKVQLQVWDDLCHVGPTLSFTRPAKFMFRGIAQFGAWALATAQRTEIHIIDDDDVSDIGSISSDEEAVTQHEAAKASADRPHSKASEREERRKVYEDAVRANQDGSGIGTHKTLSAISLRTVIGKAGDPLPPFHKNMIRQRVTRHGDIYPLPPARDLPALNMSPANVGVIKSGPVRRWLDAHDAMSKRFASAKRRTQLRRLKQMKKTAAEAMVFVKPDGEGAGETPPPSALAGRKRSQLPKAAKRGTSMALGMWSGWNSKHDEEAISNEQEKREAKEGVNMSITTARSKSNSGGEPAPLAGSEPTAAADPSAIATAAVATAPAGTAAVDHTAPPAADLTVPPVADSNPAPAIDHAAPAAQETLAPAADISQVESQRSQVGDGVVPFKVRPPLAERNPSTMTLTGESGIVSPVQPGSPNAASTAAAPATPASPITPTAPVSPAAIPASPVSAPSPAAEANAAPSSSGKLRKTKPAGDQRQELQREQSTKSWARNVLRRSGIGSISLPRDKPADAAPSAVSPEPVAVAGAGAGAAVNGQASPEMPQIAITDSELLDPTVKSAQAP